MIKIPALCWAKCYAYHSYIINLFILFIQHFYSASFINKYALMRYYMIYWYGVCTVIEQLLISY